RDGRSAVPPTRSSRDGRSERPPAGRTRGAPASGRDGRLRDSPVRERGAPAPRGSTPSPVNVRRGAPRGASAAPRAGAGAAPGTASTDTARSEESSRGGETSELRSL